MFQHISSIRLRTITVLTAIVISSLSLAITNMGTAHADTDCSPNGVLLYGTDSSWLNGTGVNVCNYPGNGGNVCVPVTGAPASSYCSAGNVWSGTKWQCVEMVNRLYLTKRWTTATWFGNGSTLINNVPSGLTEQNNGAISDLNPGDVITLTNANDPAGHAAIINSISGTTVNIINQNAQLNSSAYIDSGSLANGNAHLHMNAWTTYTVQAIVHHPTTPTIHFQPFAADFNHDGYADIGLRDATGGTFFIKHGPSFTDQITYNWAIGTQYQPFAADFDGDGTGDIGLYDQSAGVFFIKHGPTFADQLTYSWAAGTQFQAFVGDFNGDGYADIGLRDMNVGTFFIKHGPTFNDQITYNWAIGSKYQPYAADFDGDHIGDIGMRDQNAGTFFIKHGTSFADQLSYSWAIGTQFQPFAADFDGNGQADIGIRDKNTGTFFIKHGPTFNDQLTYSWAKD